MNLRLVESSRLYWEKTYKHLNTFETCKHCSICGPHKPLLGMGNPDAEVAIVAEALGKDELKHRQPLIGRSGQIFNKALKEAGVDRKSLWLTNTCAGNPLKESTGKNRTPTEEEIVACFPHILEELRKLPNLRLVITLGRTPLEAFLGRKIKTMREYTGKEIESPYGYRVLSCYHPASILYGKRGNFKKIVNVIKKAHLSKEKQRDYNILTEFSEVLDFVKELKEAKGFALDTEATSLNVYEPSYKLMGISFSLKENTGVYIPITKPSELDLFGDGGLEPFWSKSEEAAIVGHLRDPIESSDIFTICQGGDYDYQALKVVWDIEMIWQYDTRDLEKQIAEEELGGADLESLTWKYCPDQVEFKKLLSNESGKGPAKKSFVYTPLGILGIYAAADADSTLKVFKEQWKILKKEHKKDSQTIMEDS